MLMKCCLFCVSVNVDEVLMKCSLFCVSVYVEDAEVLTEVFGVVARLCVRDEFCQQVVEMDGTITIFTTLQRHFKCQVGY